MSGSETQTALYSPVSTGLGSSNQMTVLIMVQKRSCPDSSPFCILILPLLGWALLACAQETTCAWADFSAGIVRDAVFLDGGQLYANTWEGAGWKAGTPTSVPVPEGAVQNLNLSTSTKTPWNITEVLAMNPLTAGGSYDGPEYTAGSMFFSLYELYLFGQVYLPAKVLALTNPSVVSSHLVIHKASLGPS